MERSPTEPPADPSARTFSQVVFTDIPRSYPPATAVTCYYTLTAGYQPHPRDWVGIFKVGWSITKDYHTFVWAEHSQDGQQSVTRQAVFKDYYLPKDETEFYQFCYVDNAGQVRGASTPFSFKTAVEHSMDSSPEDDLLVITTQEQVDQGVREKAELQKELDQIREENETLKTALQREQQGAASLKGQNELKEKEKTRLVKELEQVKEQNGNLNSILEVQLQEVEHLKKELLVQQTKLMEIQEQSATGQNKLSLSFDGASIQNETHAQEKYDRALLKIKQLKEERKELKEKIDAQSEEISKLNSTFRERERELLKTKDSMQLLQVDLQSSEKEKEKLSAELHRLLFNTDEVKTENQKLRRRLSQVETQQSSPHDDLRVQHQTVASQLQDAMVKLAAEKEETLNAKTRAEHLERQLREVKEHLEKIATSCDQEKEKSSKFEMHLLEAREEIEKRECFIEEQENMIRLVRHEKDELARENETLRGDIEGLRSAYGNFHDTQAADPIYTQPDDTVTSQEWQRQETPQETENLYETIEDIPEAEEEHVLVCRHCRESFPGITQNELEQHEQSHRVCPFCNMICDCMEQCVFEDHVYSHEI